MLKHKYTSKVEGLDMSFSTGTIAKQASGAVFVQSGETIVFVSAVAASSIREGQDWFPLSVDYREKFSAAGRFPGGYFKREGRPSEKEILTSRLCDRPLRPLFPKGFLNEVQVIGNLTTCDGVVEPDVLMVNGASAALIASDIPWNGPVGCVRLGEIDGEFVVNPTNEQMLDSDLDLLYVGNETEMMMIEGSAEEMPEARFIEALEYAQEAIQPIIKAQKELAAAVAKQKKEFKLIKVTDENLAFCREFVGNRLEEAVFLDNKSARGDAVNAIQEECGEALKAKVGEEEYNENQLKMAFEVLQEEVYRQNILEKGKRSDGRGPDDLRPIECDAGILPRVHGSSMFQRGETQNIVITTLGTSGDAQEMDGLSGGPKEKSFILHYNFPPYSVGETGRFFGPGRREIGHGALAERSLLPVIPDEDEFNYAIRLVSDIMESNGSSSMASVCGGCLALMDAGVPITGMVAGISVGLVTEMDDAEKITKSVILTDILGAEDHFGDMDFKICGTREGITGFQLDLKIKGLPMDIAKDAIAQNTKARYEILDIMAKVMPEPRKELSEHAPRIHKMQIEPDKIGALIGPGGKNIRRIVDISGAQIDIDDDNSGKVYVYATSGESMQRAIEEIELSVGDIEIGKTYRGTVRGVKDFGCFVECLPGKEGLVHISELSEERVERTEDVAKIGDEMWVKCIGVEANGKVRLSRRIAMAEREAAERGEPIPEIEPRQRGEGGGGRGGDRGGRGGDRGGRGGDRGGRGGRGGDRGGRGGDRGGRGRGPREDNDGGENGGDGEDKPRRRARRSDRPRRERREDGGGESQGGGEE